MIRTSFPIISTMARRMHRRPVTADAIVIAPPSPDGVSNPTSRDPDLGGIIRSCLAVPGGILAARVHHHRPRRPRPEWDDGMGNPKEDGGDGVHHDMHHPPSPYHFMVEDYNNNDGAATLSSSSAAADRYARLLRIGGGEFGLSRAQLGGGIPRRSAGTGGSFSGALEGHHGRRGE